MLRGILYACLYELAIAVTIWFGSFVRYYMMRETVGWAAGFVYMTDCDCSMKTVLKLNVSNGK